MLLNILGWELVLLPPFFLFIGIRLMASISDVNASLVQLETDLGQLLPAGPSPTPVATAADLDNVKARIDAADVTVRTLLAAQQHG